MLGLPKAAASAAARGGRFRLPLLLRQPAGNDQMGRGPTPSLVGASSSRICAQEEDGRQGLTTRVGRLHSRIGVAGIKGNQVPAQELMPAILPPVAFAVEGPPTAAEWCCSHQAELAWGMEQKIRSPWPARDPAGSLTGLIRFGRHSWPSNQSHFRLGAYPTFPFCHFHPV